jgi:hypothetical protein
MGADVCDCTTHGAESDCAALGELLAAAESEDRRCWRLAESALDLYARGWLTTEQLDAVHDQADVRAAAGAVRRLRARDPAPEADHAPAPEADRAPDAPLAAARGRGEAVMTPRPEKEIAARLRIAADWFETTYRPRKVQGAMSPAELRQWSRELRAIAGHVDLMGVLLAQEQLPGGELP